MCELENIIDSQEVPLDLIEVVAYVEAALAGDPEVKGLLFGDQMRSPEAEAAYWTIRHLVHDGRQPKLDISKWI